jgi:hypothetical protein
MAETYNPIIEIKNLDRQGLLQKPPVAEAGVALVFSGDGRPLLTVMQGQKTITWGEARWSYNKLYRVDMTEHPLSFQCDLPCKGDAYQFHAEVTFRCSVRNPQTIVEKNITDVAQWIKSSVEKTMRDISRQYEIKDSGNAEIPMRHEVNQAISESGFNLSHFILKLSLEKEVAEWIKTDTRIQEDIQREQTQQDLERQRRKFALEQEEQNAELARKQLEQQQIQANEFKRKELEAQLEQQKLQQELARNQLEQQQNLQNELKRKELEAQLEQQKLQQDLARQQAEFEFKLMEQKTTFYSSILQAGNLQILALQLAQSPGDIQAILQALNQEKQLDRAYKIQVLETLLKADAIEGWQLTEVGKRAIKELMGTAEQFLPAAPIATDNNDNNKVQVQPNNEPNWEEDEDK